MDLVISMRVKPGDEEITRASIRMYDKGGVASGEQILLEGETAETQLTVPPEGRCVVEEISGAFVNDGAQKSAVPLGTTEGDPLDPTATPQNEKELREYEELYAKKYNEKREEQRKARDAERKKYGLETKEEREKREEGERSGKTPEELRNEGYARDTSKPGSPPTGPLSQQGQPAKPGASPDMSKGISTSKDDDASKMDPTKRK